VKKFVLILLIAVSTLTSVTAQTIFKDEAYGFSIEQPKDWLVGDNKIRMDNLAKLKIDETALNEMIKSNKGSLLLTSFYKYDIKTTAGLIPTIQINVLNNPTTTFEQFNTVMSQSTGVFKNYFPDFKFLKELTIIEINGVKAVYFIGAYTMNTAAGVKMKVRSRTYAIPYGNYFFQVNFTDHQDKEDDTKLFEALIQTIKVGK
jgi:hypothetical protein